MNGGGGSVGLVGRLNLARAQRGAKSAESGSAELATDGDDEESIFVLQTNEQRPSLAIADNKTLSSPPPIVLCFSLRS